MMIRNALPVHPIVHFDPPPEGAPRRRKCRDCGKTVRYKQRTNLGWLHFCKDASGDGDE